MPRGVYKRRPLILRFWEKVDCTGGPDVCWPWRGGTTTHGYGRFGTGDGKMTGAHAFALRIEKGAAPKDKPYACHRCDNPSCCNPKHLFWASPQGNYSDSKRKCRNSEGKRHAASLGTQRLPRALRHHNGKLSNKDTADIRRLSCKLSWTELALKYGITRRHAWAVGTGRVRAV